MASEGASFGASPGVTTVISGSQISVISGFIGKSVRPWAKTAVQAKIAAAEVNSFFIVVGFKLIY